VPVENNSLIGLLIYNPDPPIPEKTSLLRRSLSFLVKFLGRLQEDMRPEIGTS